MAEALLRDRLARRGEPARVHSAGLLRSGDPSSRFAGEVLTGRGLDLSSHRSTTISRSLVTGADLVLGMARAHVREAVVLDPQVWPRAYTLKELVRRGEDAGPRAAGQSVEEWLAKVHAGRSHSDLLGESDEDDIFDPIGSARPVYERTATEIESLVDRLVDLLFTQAGPPPEEAP